MPGIHVFSSFGAASKTWMVGTTLAIAVAIARPAMTAEWWSLDSGRIIAARTVASGRGVASAKEAAG
jgi:hypothetical protein